MTRSEADRFPTVDDARRRRYRDTGLWSSDLLDGQVETVAARDPGRVAVVDGDRRVTYAELQEQVVRIAAGLRRLGVRRGEVVSSIGSDAEGWIDTGDRGSVDAAGYLTVTGRSKDIILRGGENISAKEVEDLLYAHPDVADVAVVAVPDPRLTERACAVVVPRPGTSPTLADLTAFLDTTGTAKQKYPERLELVEELPRTPTGKIQKFRLREWVADHTATDPM